MDEVIKNIKERKGLRYMLRIKDDVDLKRLKDFGFRPKYNEDTGRIERFIYEEQKWKQGEAKPTFTTRIEISEKSNIGKMEPFITWWEITYTEHKFLFVLYDLITAGLVEKIEE